MALRNRELHARNDETISIYLFMLMTHLREIGTKCRYRFPMRLTGNLVPNFSAPVSSNNQDMLYFRAGLCYQFSGMGFRRQFLVCVS